MMQRDRQPVIVHPPQVLKQHFSLAAGVDEDERGLVALDEIVDFAERVARGMPGPGQPLPRIEHFNDRRGGAAGHHDVGRSAFAARLGHQKPRELLGFGHRRRQSDRAQLRRQPPQPCQPQRQQIAAL